MRVAYLIAAVVLTVLTVFNVPRIPWIAAVDGGPIGLFRGFSHGVIGFSYLASWLLIIGGVYLILLGVLYWDMDTSEHERWQFALQSGGTARILWIGGILLLVLGIAYAVFVYTHDNQLWPSGIASTVFCFITAWLYWLGLPLYEQVGIDREETGI